MTALTGTLRGIALMVTAMAAFAVADLCIKLASVSLSSAAILFWMGLLGTVIFAVLTLAAGQALLSRAFFDRWVLTRNGVEVFATFSMILALANAPLSLVASITQATPLVVTLGAALFLGERVGPRRWAAIFVGLAGVLLILRPGVIELSFGALCAVLATIGLGSRDVLTRKVRGGISTLQLSAYGFAVLVPPAAAWMGVTEGLVLPAPREALLVTAASVFAAIAYYAVTASMRVGDVSLITPFRYSRLIFALILAGVFLGERPDGLTLLGAGVVIGSGLFVLMRERALARQAATAEAARA